MRAKLQAGDLDEVEMTLSIKMTVREWRAMYAQLDGTHTPHPKWEVRALIASALAKLDASLSILAETEVG